MTVEKDKQLTKPRKLRSTLEMSKAKFLSVMPKTLGALDTRVEWLIRSFLLAAVNDPSLYNCTWESQLQTVLDTAALGLDFSKALGQAYPVPFGKKCTLIVGYRGLVGLARRTGDVAMVEARNVYECDEFAIQNGTDPKIHHIPRSDFETNEKFIGSYMVVTMPDGTKQIDWMTDKDIERIRARSPAANKGPWVTDIAEMRKKTVVHRGLKMVPMSPELARGLEIEYRGQAGLKLDELKDVTPAQAPDKAAEIGDDIDAAKERLDLKEPATADDVESRRETAQKIIDDAKRQPGEDPGQTEMPNDGK